MKLLMIHLMFLALVVPVTALHASEEEAVYETLESDLSTKTYKSSKRKANLRGAVKEFKSISDLADLSPVEDIAVINKKYMPKTKRFELSLQGMVGLNNAFFSNLGAAGHLGWYLSEKWGLELSYIHLIDSERAITKNLRSERQIETRSFVLPESYYGAAIKWSPIYGKMALFEERIVSFDWYFTLGGGMTKTQEASEPTLHLGVGQYLALTKNMAFRWDINWNMYQANIQQKQDGTYVAATVFHNDLFLAFGVSFFFPEVNYR